MTTKKVCLSFDPNSSLSGPAQSDVFKRDIFKQLMDAGHEPFEAVIRGCGTDFVCEPGDRMDMLLILHRSTKSQSVHFNMDSARLPIGSSICSIEVILVKFPGVDYSRFSVSTDRVNLSTLNFEGDGPATLRDLLPELFVGAEA